MLISKRNSKYSSVEKIEMRVCFYGMKHSAFFFETFFVCDEEKLSKAKMLCRKKDSFRIRTMRMRQMRRKTCVLLCLTGIIIVIRKILFYVFLSSRLVRRIYVRKRERNLFLFIKWNEYKLDHMLYTSFDFCCVFFFFRKVNIFAFLLLCM